MFKSVVVASALVLCISAGGAAVLPATAAAKSAKTSLDRVEIIASSDAEGKTLVDVKASVSEDMALPASVTILAPEFFKLEKAESFDITDPKKVSKIDYESGSELEQMAYTFKLTKNRGVALQFSGEALTINQSGHVIFALGWTMFTDTKSVLIGTIVPDNYIGSGTEIQKFGQDTSGNNIFGRAYSDVKAGTECVASMAFVSTGPGGTGTPEQDTIAKAEAEKAAAQKRTNTYIIMGVSALLAVAIIALIVTLLKGRRTVVDDFDGPDGEGEDEDEFDDEDADHGEEVLLEEDFLENEELL